MIFFLFLMETICCDPSSEPSRRDGSDEGLQHMFSCRINNKKKHLLISSNTPSSLELWSACDFNIIYVEVFANTVNS